MNAFANWLDNDPHFIGFLAALVAAGGLLAWLVSRIRGSRGEEAGTPEDQERSDDQKIVRVDPSDRRAVAAVFGEYAREMPELRRYADEVEGLYLIEVER